MAAFLVFVTIIFFYIKAKNKLAEIAGEQIKINVDDDDNIKKKKDNKAKPVKKQVLKAAKKMPHLGELKSAIFRAFAPQANRTLIKRPQHRTKTG